jgi:hypothetical protein
MQRFTPNETDVVLRLVEVWYDITWAYYMSSSGDHVANRLDKRRKVLSSSASVATAVTEDGMNGKSMKEKLQSLEKGLVNIKTLMKARQFEDICRVSLKSNDDLYPGFKDVLPIVQQLMRTAEPYSDLLTREEIKRMTLPQIFQSIYYQLCTFLLATRVGREACKLVITPTKITHATYDVCRQKFCRLLCDETRIVQNGLMDTIHRIHNAREAGHGEEQIEDSDGDDEDEEEDHTSVCEMKTNAVAPPASAQASSSSRAPPPLRKANDADAADDDNETAAATAEPRSSTNTTMAHGDNDPGPHQHPASTARPPSPPSTSTSSVSEPVFSPPPPPPAPAAHKAPKTPAELEVEVELKLPKPCLTRTHTSTPTTPMVRKTRSAVDATTTNNNTSRSGSGSLRFPVVDLSTDDEDNSSSSSYEST